MNGAAHYTTNYNAADEVIVVQGVNQHLQGSFHIYIRSGNIFQNNLEQGLQIIIVILHGQLSNTVTSGCINNGEF